MDEKIRVSPDLRARDVPIGTKVTPRGREYTIMGLLGGWIAGGVVMYLTWDMANPAISALKVFGAATVGSLLGTFGSWFMPSTRERMKVIQELKVHLEEEREAEAEAAREVVGRTARAPKPPPRVESWRTPEPEVTQTTYYESSQTFEAPREYTYTPQDEPAPPPKPRRPIERVERKRVEGDTNALLDALDKYSTIDPDEPRGR